MELLDGTIVTTSAPRIAHSLGVPTSSVSLIITAYLVTVATLIPVGGWMSARFGARRILLVAITAFASASLGCALSGSLAELVAFRVLQGAAGAMLVPVGRAMVFSAAPKETLMRMTALLVWPALVAPVIAPLAGGLITTYASWHWLFLINLPLGAIALVAAFLIIHPPREPAPGPLDGLGVVLTCVGIASLTVACALLSRKSSGLVLCLGAAIITLLLVSIAVRHLLRADHPLLDLHTLRIRTLRTSLGGTALYFAVNAAGPFLAPLMFEEVFGWSPVKSGAVVLLIFVGNIGVKPSTTYLYSRFGFRSVIITATSGMALMMLAMAGTTATTPVVVIGLILLLSGMARSVGATGYMTMAFGDVPPAQMRDASTLQTTIQQLAAGFGVTGAAIALRIGHAVSSSTETQFRIAFVLVALVALTATAAATRFSRDDGNVLRTPSKALAADGSAVP